LDPPGQVGRRSCLLGAHVYLHVNDEKLADRLRDALSEKPVDSQTEQ